MSHKPSRFRHANLVAVRRDQCYFDLKPTSALWDLGNMVTANENVLALPILSLTGGRVAVLPLNKGCKVPSTVPSLMSHTAPVVDLTFNPFQRDVLVTGSEDTTIKLWKVPNEGLTEHLADPMATLTGHTKKVGILQFHPSAENVLLSAALDHKIKLWDISENKQHSELTVHKDMIQSVNFNLDGSLINTTCRDKKLRVLDVRSGDVVATVNGHQGSKATRSIWAKKMNVIITTGFDKDQHRQLMVWDVKNLKEPIHVQEVDRLTSVFMPMFDEDTGVLFLGGKGDTSISLWDINTSRTPIVLHATTMSCGTDPQRGLCLLPRVNLRPRDCELARLIRVTPNQTVPIAFSLPRKLAATQFQEDLYPPTFAPTPALSAKDFFGQKISKPPMLKSLRYLFDESTEEPPFAYTESNVCGSLSRQSSARPSTERGVVSNDKAKVELEAKRSSLKIKIEKATEKVQNARTELEKAEKELEELQRELKQLQ